MYYIGAHVSAAGGPEKAVANAKAIGATAFALFTKNQKVWTAPPLTDETARVFINACVEQGYAAAQILPHDSYLINLANPDPGKRRVSVEAFIEEMKRVSRLGLDRLNFHPGAHLNQVLPEVGLAFVAEALDEAVERVPGVRPVIETTAGQGSSLGATFEQIADIIGQMKRSDQVGVCIDTCHIFAAGYDIRTERAFVETMERFAKTIGFDKLMGMHLNDAKSQLGSHVDRHDSLGQGNIGWEPFRLIMQDKRFEGIPLILETIDSTLWPQEIQTLSDFIITQ
ncbi:MAG: deoxyribonuclease IV [Sphaerochaetaceae bacterium]|nr:deoxyribonuclease IV [Sphaerochaetaceae bacterium]